MPSDRRVSAMIAAVVRCRRLWRDEEPGIELLPKPQREGGPPVWLGGTGPRMLQLTGSGFEGWLPLSPTPDDYASGLLAVRQAAEEAGRDPHEIATSVYLTVAVSDDERSATAELDAYIRAYYGVPAEVMARGMALHAGTIESAHEWFAAYRAAGAEHLVVRLARPGLRDYLEALEPILEATRPA